ncbi:MAG: hypothetical protein K0Q49_1027 [Haloplasmataceae bacterium]|nr:hypothetical protein [Haloplasmataceae bacterium]
MKDIKYKKNLLLILLISIAVYLYFLLKNDASIIFNNIINIKLYYIVILISIVCVYLLIDGLTLHLFTINKVKGVAFHDTLKVNLATQFFSGITPFASGGQPFQVFYLNTRGIKTKDSTSIVMMNFIVYNVAFSIVGLTFLIWKYTYFNELLRGKEYLLLIGFLVNTFVTVITLVLAFSKRIYHFLIEKLWIKVIKWKFLRKFKLENKTEKMKDTIEGFNKEIKELNKNKKLLIVSILLNIIKILLIYTVPIIIFKGLGNNVNSYINYIVGAFFIAMIMAYIPLPGGSLGAEGIFHLIYFSLVGNKEMIISAMILWRFMTYYLLIILGAISIFSLNFQNNLAKLNYNNESVLQSTNIRYNS